MTDDLLTTAAHEAPIAVRSEEERLVDIRILPWGVVGRTAQGPERFRRGAFRGTRPEDVTLEAIGAHGLEPGVRLAGRATALEDREDGQYGTFRVSRTAAGDELLELARDGVYRGASAVFEPGASRLVDGGIIERLSARLARVGIVERGAYEGAGVLAVRNREDRAMVAETEPRTPDPEPEPTPEPPGGGIRVAIDTPAMESRMEELRRDLMSRMTSLEARGPSGSASPLARWPTLGHYLAAAGENGETATLLARALADQITGDNPGVVPPSYLGEVRGILEQTRPAVTAFGGPSSLGDSGMSIHWPYYDGDLTTLVAAQAAQKTEIQSVKVSIKDGSTAIATYAGGSDVSYQLIRRSSPAYLSAYGRIMLAGWAITTDNAFADAILALATGTVVYNPATADPNGSLALAAFFAASAKVKRATGQPATFALASSDAFQELGQNPALKPPVYGTQNLPGTAQASTLAITVSGLPVYEEPNLTAGTVIWSNPLAAAWHEDGPLVATAEDVAKLGQNRAIWSMGATAAYLPAGIVHNTLVAERAAK